jgi:hypothetical protein
MSTIRPEPPSSHRAWGAAKSIVAQETTRTFGQCQTSWIGNPRSQVRFLPGSLPQPGALSRGPFFGLLISTGHRQLVVDDCRIGGEQRIVGQLSPWRAPGRGSCSGRHLSTPVAWARWLAPTRVDIPASSISVARHLRKLSELTSGTPNSPRVLSHRSARLSGSHRVPRVDGKMTSR